MAERIAKFKVELESLSRRHQKTSREKRPSMIGEICTTGGRARGSYGNLNYASNRKIFASNRAISLDSYDEQQETSDDGESRRKEMVDVGVDREPDGMAKQRMSGADDDTLNNNNDRNNKFMLWFQFFRDIILSLFSAIQKTVDNKCPKQTFSKFTWVENLETRKMSLV